MNKKQKQYYLKQLELLIIDIILSDNSCSHDKINNLYNLVYEILEV
jgi:hypothetical protein